MSSLPPAILFCNGDITYPATPPPYPPDLDVFIGSEPLNPTSYIASASELTTLQVQLLINDTMTKAEFDARVASDPNYPIIVHLQGLRILVILPDFYDHVNRDLADIVLFLHQGMADVESNRFWDHWEEYEDTSICHTYPGSCIPPIPCNIPTPYSSTIPAGPCPLPYQSCPPCPPPPCGPFPHERRRRVAYGPPGKSYDMQRLNIYTLIRAADDHCSVFLPFEMMPHCNLCDYPFWCDKCHTFSGMKICSNCRCDCACGCYLIDNQGIKSSPVHLPNCESEAHNFAFIHRK